MTAVLFLGFLLGLQHAMEADHLAALASLAARSPSRRSVVRHGVVWGLGHMVTLSVFAGAVILFEQAVSPALAGWLEIAVGAMLMLLGGHLLYRLHRDRIHFHVHRHDDGHVHLHAHSHAGEAAPHTRSRHDHGHRHGFPLRSLLVGMMHGLAGSAALVVLAGTALRSPLDGVFYVLIFGMGSVAGMAALSLVIAVPIGWSAKSLTWASRGLQSGVGLASLALGGFVILGVISDPAFAL
jgi:ABC-type nickel/cobalt efflux system permease component RcnA